MICESRCYRETCGPVTGVSITALEASARLLGEALEHPDAQGKKAAASLRELGITTGDLKGNMADMGDVVLQVLDKLSQIADTARRVALGQELLGRGSKQLEPLIANYAELKRVVESIHVGDNLAGSNELLNANKAAHAARILQRLSEGH
jgi:TP901 family phage tail tape measure protein